MLHQNVSELRLRAILPQHEWYLLFSVVRVESYSTVRYLQPVLKVSGAASWSQLVVKLVGLGVVPNVKQCSLRNDSHRAAVHDSLTMVSAKHMNDQPVLSKTAIAIAIVLSICMVCLLATNITVC